MDIIGPANYPILQAQGTPGFARDMHKLAAQEAADAVALTERKRARQAIKEADFEASWPPVRICRPIGQNDASLKRFQDQIENLHPSFGRALPHGALEVALVGHVEIAKMLSDSRSRVALSVNPKRMKRVVNEDIEHINSVIADLRDQQVEADKVHGCAETPDLWLRSFNPDATNWPDDIKDLPLIDESGLVLNGLWARAELEIGERIEVTGKNGLALELTGSSADMVVEERRLVLEALHTELGYDMRLADKAYEPRMQVFETFPNVPIVAAHVTQPKDIPYYVPFNEPRAIQTPIYRPTV